MIMTVVTMLLLVAVLAVALVPTSRAARANSSRRSCMLLGWRTCLRETSVTWTHRMATASSPTWACVEGGVIGVVSTRRVFEQGSEKGKQRKIKYF